MNILHLFSIILEAAIAIMGIAIVANKKKFYGWGIAFTFGIYVLYDLSKFLSVPIAPDILYILFFGATLSAFLSVWQILKEK